MPSCHPSQLFNDPVQPYAPFEVPDDLRARAKVKGKDSWKVRLELREAEARAALEAAEGPVEGCVELSALYVGCVAPERLGLRPLMPIAHLRRWYTRIGGRPKPEEVPQPESKRSKARAAKLRKAEQKAAAQAAKVAVDPYGSAATAGNASRAPPPSPPHSSSIITDLSANASLPICHYLPLSR